MKKKMTKLLPLRMFPFTLSGSPALLCIEEFESTELRKTLYRWHQFGLFWIHMHLALFLPQKVCRVP